MSDTAAQLVEQMVAAGEWPEPSLLEAIMAHGEQAVDPLPIKSREQLVQGRAMYPQSRANVQNLDIVMTHKINAGQIAGRRVIDAEVVERHSAEEDHAQIAFVREVKPLANRLAVNAGPDARNNWLPVRREESLTRGRLHEKRVPQARRWSQDKSVAI